MPRRDDHAYNEWAAEALMDGDERLEWERSRNVDLGLSGERPPTAAMIARWAAERAEVEAESADTAVRWDGWRSAS